MVLKKDLQDHQVLLLLMSGPKYTDSLFSVMKLLKGKTICYVTLNKTYQSLKETFEKNKIPLDNVVFIDAITNTFSKQKKETDNCYYLSSPGALTEISICVSRFLRHEFDYIIFDSLTNLLIYEKKSPVAKFVGDLINKIRATDTRAVFYALDVQDQSTLIGESSMFVDKVVTIK